MIFNLMKFESLPAAERQRAAHRFIDQALANAGYSRRERKDCITRAKAGLNESDEVSEFIEALKSLAH